MLTKAIKGKNFKFRDCFNELTVGIFSDFLGVEIELSKLEDEEERLEKDLKELKKNNSDSDLLREVIFIDSQLVDVDYKIRARKLELLMLLAYRPNRLKRYAKFITHDFTDTVLGIIHNKIHGFEKWVNGVKLVKKFRFKDYKKPKFWSISKITKFEVFDTTKTTVLRDYAATLVARKIDDLSDQFAKNRWSNLSKFVAYVCRPEIEQEETPVGDKKGFFRAGKLNNLTLDDRLKAYNDLLAETVDKRADLFRDLPLVIAIGVYKQYFFLSRR